MTQRQPTPSEGKTLILHIGDHKTGSTTLQNAFATGQVFVEGARILYPANLNHNYLLGVFRAEAADQTSFFVPRPGRPDLAQLRAQIEATDAEYIVISGEQFENLEAADFKRVTDRWFADVVARVRVVAYARPHAQRFISNFAELVKIGAIEGGMDAYLERILDTGRYHFAARFGRWRTAFGEDFLLRPMIREQLYNGSVVDDFAHYAFDKRPVRFGSFAIDNQSTGLSELMFLKFIQDRFDQSQKFIRHTMAREIVRYMGVFGQGRTSDKLRLHRALATDLRALYWEDACALDAAFFAGEPLFETALEEACDAATEEPASLEPADYFTAEELRYLGALREILWDAMQTPKNWSAIFHKNRVQNLHSGASLHGSAATQDTPV
jgi:hypothetical protein